MKMAIRINNFPTSIAVDNWVQCSFRLYCIATAGTSSILRLVQVRWNISSTCGRREAVQTIRRPQWMISSTVCVPWVAPTPPTCSTITFTVRACYSSAQRVCVVTVARFNSFDPCVLSLDIAVAEGADDVGWSR